jgi:molybdenum cofactor cytidylyltransferase
MGTPQPSEAPRSSTAVSGLLLAAGASSRLGQPKQLLPFGDRPLIRHVVEQALASRLADLTVVVGNQAPAMRAALEGLPVRIVENPAYLQGQSTSLRAGLLALPRACRAVLVLLVDQPFVEAALIDRLIGLYEETGAPVVAPQHAGRRGNPVLFDHALVPELLTVVGDTGAREVIARHRDRLVTLPLPDDRPFLDVDTWEDYRRIQPDLPSGSPLP